NLPHIQSPGRIYHLTFRTQGVELSEAARKAALDACLHWNGKKAEVHACVVMPDHVHLLLTPVTIADQSTSVSLTELLHSIKSYSANQINKLLRRKGSLWQDESFDRYIRSDADLEEKYNYIRDNPVKAGLVERFEDYRFLYLQYDRPHRLEAGATQDKTHRLDAGATQDKTHRLDAGAAQDKTHRLDAGAAQDKTHRLEAGATQDKTHRLETGA